MSEFLPDRHLTLAEWAQWAEATKTALAGESSGNSSSLPLIYQSVDRENLLIDFPYREELSRTETDLGKE